MKRLILIITVILTGCAYKVKTQIQPLSIIETYKLDTTKIRFDGYYNNIVDTIFYSNGYKYNFPKSSISDRLVVFNKNKNIYIEGGATIDSSSFTCKYYQDIEIWYKTHNENYLGRFTIKNDSVYAYALTSIRIRAGGVTDVYCNYKGYIKNRDTITDWGIVPPYSEDFTKFVIENNKNLLRPHTLYFVKTDAVKCLQMD